jgi:hypothetical protein
VAGRFPLYTDADIHGPVVDALRGAGWDLVRAIDTFAEGTLDDEHFAYAAREGRVIVANDIDLKLLALRWLTEGRPFRGLVWWPREHYQRMGPGDFLDAFEELAAGDDPFASYPIVHITPRL